MAEAARIGLVGLGVMGRSLALNMRDHGIGVLGGERDAALAALARESGLEVAEDLADLVRRVPAPRTIMLMVTAGPAVDEVLDRLLEVLAPGDAVVDGGNSDFRDTARRAERLAPTGIDYVGLGVSGGEDGARYGPALMPAGPEGAWSRLAPVLEAIAARAPDGTPCVSHLSPAPAAGHFVKMVHNGIEYADMQLIAEVHDILSRGAGLPAAAIADRFEAWNKGPLASYLVEITAVVLRKIDPETGRPLVDLIRDRAEQKGTGRWTAINALDLGVAAPTIAEAVFARVLSSRDGLRAVMAERFAGGRASSPPMAIDDRTLEDALYVAKLIAYAQGFDLLRAGGEANEWFLDLASIARLWRGGCIIRADLLGAIAAAFDVRPAEEAPESLLLGPGFAAELESRAGGLRSTVIEAARAGIPVPALSSALAYLDGLSSGRLPAALTQAQRDCFGAHTYERTDRPGRFHTTDWLDPS